jgi:hypothetical protein
VEQKRKRKQMRPWRKMFEAVYRLLNHPKLQKKHRKAAEAFLRGEIAVRQEKSHIDAAKSLRDVKVSKRDGNKRAYAKHWAYADTQLQKWADAMIQECRKRQIPLYAFELHRTPERQQQLMFEGRSKAGPWKSAHQFGMGIDLIHESKLWSLSNAEWEIIGAIGKEIARKKNIKITWGGDWGWDYAHWELTDWRKSDVKLTHDYMVRNRIEIPNETEKRFERYKVVMPQALEEKSVMDNKRT